MTWTIREEQEGEQTQVAEVVARAFGRSDEALLVESLRNSGDIALSLVALHVSDIIGHIAFQALNVVGGTSPVRAASLAPVSVVPAHRRKGVGKQLIQTGAARLARRGFDLIFVLGDPAYYARFGFSSQRAAGFDAPWKAPYFQALALSQRPLSQGRLIYPAAFFPGAS